MITLETAVAAIFTFVVGLLAGCLLTITCIQYALRTKHGRALYQHILEKAERHEKEHHDDVGQQT
jgi:hypothetical protein